MENNIGAAMHPVLIGKAVRTRRAFRRSERFRSANIQIFANFSNLPRFAYKQSTNHTFVSDTPRNIFPVK
jgi:hypothetical protein